MQQENIGVSAPSENITACVQEDGLGISLQAQPENTSEKSKRASLLRRVMTVAGKTLLVLLETVLLLAVALYGVMYVLAKGPSPTARDLFVHSVRETSAVGFLANLFFTEDEIRQITAAGSVPEYEEMDTSLIEIPKPGDSENPSGGPTADAWGLIDEDGDGIIVEPVKGEGYSGYMMVVLDPSRVIMGSDPSSYGKKGYTVAQMVQRFDAVAGINAGGFYDPNGSGNGSIPDTMVVHDGTIYYPELGTGSGFAGFDSNHILHVGRFTPGQIQQRDIQYGVCFGPVLIVNGVARDPATLGSGVNPRTAIGQRSDGAVLLLVIDGRQVTSLGATYTDLVEVFLSYGAVNACNLDGGSSSMMWYQGGYINNCASVTGVRPVPTSFLVLKQEVGSHD
ncbi:MAG: phosphodiester glycosidase family protein [Oscillospiraceae bacterium]|nr:phosphodiester glycosidase family protein [Oscillospiraceae bacterium]